MDKKMKKCFGKWLDLNYDDYVGCRRCEDLTNCKIKYIDDLESEGN